MKLTLRVSIDMREEIYLKPLLIAIMLLLSIAQSPQACADPVQRAIAITIDDLPGPPAGLVSNDTKALRENTVKLLAALQADAVPAVGFVNEGKLFLPGETSREAGARLETLSLWSDAGFELGNHTYSHISLNTTPLETFEEDVLRGETVTRWLMAQNHKSLRYFRHPFLQVGLDLEKRRSFEKFLKERGYTIAPVTIDDDDYIYAAVYAAALRRGEHSTAAKIGEDYLRYMTTIFDFHEQVSQRLVGRQIRQILLIHANTLNADYFTRLAELLKARGYRFISLQDALEDEIYRRPDEYVGTWGISWLHHWELTAGRKRSPQPDAAPWILQAYRELNH